jgi:hypothetical protein
VRRKWVLCCIAVGAFLLGLLLAFAPSAAAQTTIAWQPSHQDDTGFDGWHEYLICKDIYDRGTSVYDMSYQVAKALGAKLGGLSTATAIITRGDTFPDAIGISPLACYKKWPILLTDSGTTPNASAAKALSELSITKALKVGTYSAMPAAVTSLANLSGAESAGF